MPRGVSFFRHPIRWLEDKLTPRRPPKPPPEPPRPPPGRPGLAPPGGGPGDFYRRIWDTEVSRSETREVRHRTGYSRNEQLQLHTELFLSTGMTELDRDEQEQAWQDYLDSFVTGRSTHADWFNEWGLDPRDFDWQAWRHALGYERRRG